MRLSRSQEGISLGAGLSGEQSPLSVSAIKPCPYARRSSGGWRTSALSGQDPRRCYTQRQGGLHDGLDVAPHGGAVLPRYIGRQRVEVRLPPRIALQGDGLVGASPRPDITKVITFVLT